MRLTAFGLALTASMACTHSMDDDAAQAPSDAFTEEERADFDGYVREALESFNVPGAAVAIVRGDRIAYMGTFGVRTLGDDARVTPQTKFLLGSLTRTMTATVLAALVDDGLLDWDGPVVDWLPTFQLSDPTLAPQVRVRDLMNHGSGVESYETPLLTYLAQPLELIDSLASIPVVADRGQVYSYQIQLVATAGFLAARAAGAEYTDEALQAGFEHLLAEKLFEPVGMPGSTTDYDVALAGADRASPHSYDPAREQFAVIPGTFDRFVVPVSADRAVWSGIDDLARYMLTELHDGVNPEGQRVVSRESLNETQLGETPISEDTSASIGWTVTTDDDGQRTLLQDGRTAGFTARLMLRPDADWGIAIVTNRAYGANFLEAVSGRALEQRFGAAPVDRAALLENEMAIYQELDGLRDGTGPVARDSVTQYLGRYAKGVTLSHSDDHLVLDTDLGQMPLKAAIGYPGVFVATGSVGTGLAVQVADDDNGNATLTIGFGDFSQPEFQQIRPLTLALEKRAAPGSDTLPSSSAAND